MLPFQWLAGIFLRPAPADCYETGVRRYGVRLNAKLAPVVEVRGYVVTDFDANDGGTNRKCGVIHGGFLGE